MDTLSWATNSPPRFSGEAFAPGCPASLAQDEGFFRKPFRHVNNPFRSSDFLYSPFVGIRYSHARNLYSEFIGMPYSHGPESATSTPVSEEGEKTGDGRVIRHDNSSRLRSLSERRFVR